MYSEEPKKSHKGHNKRIICLIGTNVNTEPENAQIVSFFPSLIVEISTPEHMQRTQSGCNKYQSLISDNVWAMQGKNTLVCKVEIAKSAYRLP